MIDYVRFTLPQRSFLSDPEPTVLWRDANQLGKSFALAYEIVASCRGVHALKKVRRAPIRVLVIGVSLEQMAPLMEKIWNLVPKNEISPKCGFDPGRGITGKPPRIVFDRGPGKGSLVVFATYMQGATRVAGGTFDLVVMDEPPTESMYGEVRPRVLKKRGRIRIGMTPTPDMPDQSWLRELVESGSVPEHNFHLKEAHCWPEGNPAPWLYQDEIEEYANGLLVVERKMRTQGSWDPVVEGALMNGFGPDCVRDFEPPAGADLFVGIDHGADSGKQAAMLVAVTGRFTSRPRCYFIDELTTDGFTTPEQDAAGILAMLRRRGLQYDDVDEWIGDRPTGSARRDIRKSNRDLRNELALALRRPVEHTRPIHKVKKFSGSMSYGVKLVNSLFVRRDGSGLPHGLVHPRCVRFAEACEKFDGNPKHPAKDILDAGRYAYERAVRRNATGLLSRGLVAHY